MSVIIKFPDNTILSYSDWRELHGDVEAGRYDEYRCACEETGEYETCAKEALNRHHKGWRMLDEVVTS